MSEQNQEPTFGMQRVRANFNPSNSDDVGNFKLKVAELIDLCKEKSDASPDPEVKRWYSVAMTEFESASHFGVKALTA